MKDDVWNRIRAIADRKKVNKSTFRAWKARGDVPRSWHLTLFENGISVADLKGLASAKKGRRHA